MLDSREVSCPYCAQSMEIELDPSGGSSQQYTEDCQVCCRPWVVCVTTDADGDTMVELKREDD